MTTAVKNNGIYTNGHTNGTSKPSTNNPSKNHNHHKLKNGNKQQKPSKPKKSVQDFEVIRVIGKGGYGEVRVVRLKSNGEVFAMKTLLKKKMIEKKQQKHVRTERDLMVDVDNWLLVRLLWSFQDIKYLYLVMEYCPGGDLMKILIKEDILSEPVTRFYMAECAAAIHCLHEMDYVHRDLKPDNMLIAKDGHMKLSDFGLAKSCAVHSTTKDIITKYQSSQTPINASGSGSPSSPSSSFKMQLFKNSKKARKNRKLLYSAVGTPNYIAPEVFTKKGYGSECDWWSLGVILFECVVGYPPFYADTPINTVKRIVNYTKTLRVPKEVRISKSCKDCIFRMVTAPKKRMTFHQMKRHSWFKRIPWHDLKSMQPPWIPRVQHPADTRYFEQLHNVEDSLGISKEYGDGDEHDPQQKSVNGLLSPQQTHFDGFTFERKKPAKKTAASLF